MTIAERLDTLRQSTPGCSLVAFGDLGARLVLRNSAAAQQPQEYLDQLCAQADHGFTLQDMLANPDASHDGALSEVVVVTPVETRIYVRALAGGQDTENDVILCVCDSENTAKRLISPARALLAGLTGAI